MAELVEYSLVVMASTMFVAGSVLVYGNYSSFQAGLSMRAELQAVSALATRAAQNGSAAATLSVSASTLSCQGGVLTVSVGRSSQSVTIAATCGFAVSISGGVHRLAFTCSASGLALAVS